MSFDDRLTVTGTPQVALNIGGVVRQASFASISTGACAASPRGCSLLEFHYDVQAADSDGDGIDVAANALTLNGGSIKKGTVDADLRLTNRSRCGYPGGDCAGAGIPGMLVSGARPSFAASGPALTATVGTAFDRALPAATGGNAPVGYRLVATPALPRGLVFDAATRRLHGTPAAAHAVQTYTLTATDADGSQASLSFTLGVAAPVPAVTALTVDPPQGTHTFLTGHQISVGVTFSEAVTVTGAPRLALDIGGTTRQADCLLCIAGSRTQVVFIYRVQAADVDHDGLGIGAAALTLNRGTTRSAGGTAAVLALSIHAFADAYHLRVNSGVSAPRFTSAITARSYPLGVAVDDMLPAATGATTYALTGPGGATTLSRPASASTRRRAACAARRPSRHPRRRKRSPSP